MLLDGEAFYSRSTDYGELKSHQSMVALTGTSLTSIMQGALTGQIGMGDFSSVISNALTTKSYIRYGEVPFVVHQFGIGLNVDWIISPKLIAKVNANIQRTTIDNYYQYSQADMIGRQLIQSLAAVQDDQRGISALVTELMTGAATAEATGG